MGSYEEILKMIGELSEAELTSLGQSLVEHLNRPILDWEAKGRPIPPPPRYKQRVIQEYARLFGAQTFIETGTYLGDTTFAMRNTCNRIITIEVEQKLFENAKKRFAPFSHIRVLRGDSGFILPIVLELIDERCIFWLDGHYSAGITGKGELDSPIVAELNCIMSHRIKNHVILIDDARCFVSNSEMSGYPSMEEVRNFIQKRDPGYDFVVENDIMRITKTKLED